MNIDKFKKHKNILIIGHNTPDPDTMLSSKLMKEILNDNGIKAEYAILESDYNNLKANKLVSEFNYNPCIIKDNEIKNFKYILVDHNDITQSVNDASLVIGGIDHHPDSKSTKNILFFQTCSTALAIYILFKDKYKFNEVQKKMIYNATLDDSSFGRSSRYKSFDKKIIEELGFDSDFSQEFKKHFVPTDLSNLDYAFNNSDLKTYDFNNIKFESVSIKSFNTINKDKFKDFIKNNPKNILGLWLDYSNNKTYTYFKYNDLYKENIYQSIASRSTVVLNDTLDYLRRSGFNV